MDQLGGPPVSFGPVTDPYVYWVSSGPFSLKNNLDRVVHGSPPLYRGVDRGTPPLDQSDYLLEKIMSKTPEEQKARSRRL